MFVTLIIFPHEAVVINDPEFIMFGSIFIRDLLTIKLNRSSAWDGDSDHERILDWYSASSTQS